MYTEKVMDHFQHPRNVGEIENASGVGTVGNAKCGDIMRIYLDIDENQIIQDVKFKTFGCAGADAGPVGGYPSIPLLFPALGPGAGPRRRGHDGGQRGDRRGREGGRGGLQRRGGGSAAGHLRRLFPGHLLGQPPDRAGRLRNAKKCLKSAGKCATIESTFESGAG